jgi:hypothetical protein
MPSAHHIPLMPIDADLGPLSHQIVLVLLFRPFFLYFSKRPDRQDGPLIKRDNTDRQPPPSTVHHSDRGIQYAAEAYVQLLPQHQRFIIHTTRIQTRSN